MTAEPLFKVLGRGREAIHGGSVVWPDPGEWLRVTGDLVPCRNGLHVCRARDIPLWMLEDAWVWRVEANPRFKRVERYDKVVVREARLLDPVGVLSARVLRLFAADCAEGVAHLHGHHPACMTAIRVARLYAHGVATGGDMEAAGAAAGDAARVAGAATGASARAAAWDAWAAARAAWDAARSAAWDAARSAAWDAARSAAWDAARAAQGERLLALTARYGKDN